MKAKVVEGDLLDQPGIRLRRVSVRCRRLRPHPDPAEVSRLVSLPGRVHGVRVHQPARRAAPRRGYPRYFDGFSDELLRRAAFLGPAYYESVASRISEYQAGHAFETSELPVFATQRGTPSKLVVKMTAFKDAMCACQDHRCAHAVVDDMNAFSNARTLATDQDSMSQPGDGDQLQEVTRQLQECLAKAMDH